MLHRQRIERLASFIDDPDRTPRTHAQHGDDPEFEQMTAVVRRLKDAEFAPTPSPGFQEGLRAMLLATIERDGVGVAAAAPVTDRGAERRRRGITFSAKLRRRAWIAVAGAVVIGSLSGISQASDDANPGDTLYSVKRSAESARLALAASDQSRGELHLDFARTRLAEAVTITDQKELTATLADMSNETVLGERFLTTVALSGATGAPLDVIDRFVAAQRAGLRDLEHRLPAGYRDLFTPPQEILDKVMARSAQLRPLTACGTSVVIAWDQFGPIVSVNGCRINGQPPIGPPPSGTSGAQPSKQADPTRTGSAPRPHASASTRGSTTPAPSPSGTGGGGLLDRLFGLMP